MILLKTLRGKSKKHHRAELAFVPHCLTLLNACCGFLSVVCAVHDQFTLAAWFIACSVLFDACDGRLARVLGTSSFLGAELDALADAVAFCFAPSLLVYVFYQEAAGLCMISSLLIFLCAGLFRLARFNVQQQNSQNFFSGLPTPMAALVIASLIMQGDSLGGICQVSVIDPWVAVTFILILAGLMVSAIPFPTCKKMLLSRQLVVLVMNSVVGSFVLWVVGCPWLLVFPSGYIVGACSWWSIRTLVARISRVLH
jgi:CDP-diacylglycerol---serine O-phosphatidyltransferase